MTNRCILFPGPEDIFAFDKRSVNTIQSDKVDGLNVYLHTESAQNAKIVHSLSLSNEKIPGSCLEEWSL